MGRNGPRASTGLRRLPDEIVAKLKPSGNDDRTIVVEYITAEPPVLIL